MRCASISRTATSSHRKLSAIRLPTLPHCLPRFSSIIICSLALLAACDSAGPKFKSTDITGVEYGRTLELTDQNGKPRRLEDFRGKAVVLFFGFTHCPDVCPTTLGDVANALKSLGPDGERVQVLDRKSTRLNSSHVRISYAV